MLNEVRSFLSPQQCGFFNGGFYESRWYRLKTRPLLNHNLFCDLARVFFVSVGGRSAMQRSVKAYQVGSTPTPRTMKNNLGNYTHQVENPDKFIRFDLTEGKVGNSKVRSAIGLKADAVRIIAREGIKLVTGGDLKNSQGGEVISIKGIDLIAGNDDEDLQPMAKGDNLVEALERLTFHIDSLVGAVDAMLMIQYDYNATIQNHWHISPYFSAPTTPSQTVSIKGTKAAIDYLTKVKTSLVNIKKNLAAFKITYLSSAGQKYVLSRWNNTN